tara:strand:- start:524 stop:703 length:180 start_codon:yes stop_codon:yes gene_type:complete
MSREFVDAMSAGANLEAENTFKNAMKQKVGDALENKRTEVAKTFVAQRKEMEETDESDV